MNRGGSPLNWQVLRGEREIGISLLFTEEGIDTGPVRASERFPLGPDETIDEVVAKTLPRFSRMLLEVLAARRSGALRPAPQDAPAAGYFAKRLPEDGFLDWRALTAQQAHDLVRALSGSYPGAFTYHHGTKLVIETTRRDRNVDLKTSQPIVVYRESVTGAAGPVEGKSPNHHNRFYIEIEPLKPGVVEALKAGQINMKMDELARRKILIVKGMDKEEARNLAGIYQSNIFLNMTKGVQYLKETMELILEGLEEALRNGPIAREPAQGIKAKLVDVKLHEDAVHRGPAQVIPAVRQAMQAGILMADPALLEPFQNVFIQVPQDQMSGAMSEIQGRRGLI